MIVLNNLFPVFALIGLGALLKKNQPDGRDISKDIGSSGLLYFFPGHAFLENRLGARH